MGDILMGGEVSCIINEKLFTTQILFHQTSRQSILDGEMDGCQETLKFGSTAVGEIPPFA